MTAAPGMEAGKLLRYSCTRYTRLVKTRFVTNVRVFDTNTSKVLVSSPAAGRGTQEGDHGHRWRSRDLDTDGLLG